MEKGLFWGRKLGKLKKMGKERKISNNNWKTFSYNQI